MIDKPLILVSNDDGIDSPGIYALVKALSNLGEVVVVAPDRQQSAVGHALTVAQPLRVTKFHRNGEMFGYAINGTPADCVKLAISALLDRKPDLVVSGINHGQNTSVNILYSGTVSAATEGMLVGIPSIAVSLANYRLDADLSATADYALEISTKLLKNCPDKKILLNLNVPSLPKEEIKGIKITHHSNAFWNDRYEKRTDPFGRDYYWFSGEFRHDNTDTDSDDAAIIDGYVSVTPLHFHFTDERIIQELRFLEKNI